MAVASSTVQTATELLAELVWLVLLAGAIAALAAFLYRWYVREAIPAGLSLLFGLAGVTVYLNTSRALGQVIGGSTLPTEREVALFNIAAFALATGGAVLGRRAGDRMAADVALGAGIEGVERDVGRLVQSVGRVIAVELPADIDDAVGYDPVPEETKEQLAGRTFLFPRRLTVGELHERLVSRLKADYAVGHVDLELADDGTVEYLALGSRAAGIGPTLPPATNAVAITADPAFAASAGDLVQVWETDPARRILTAELRGVAGDTVTIAIDAGDTTKVDPRTEYRLVTLPVEDRPDREFVSLLRAAEETFSSVSVEAGSPLHGAPVGALDVAVVAVEPEDGTLVGLPDPSRVLAPGDRVFAIARPDALRRLERAGKPLDPSLLPSSDRKRHPGESTPVTERDGQVADDDAIGTTDRAATDAVETSDQAAADAVETTDRTTAEDSDDGTPDQTGDTGPVESPSETADGKESGEPTARETETTAGSRDAETGEDGEDDAMGLDDGDGDDPGFDDGDDEGFGLDDIGEGDGPGFDEGDDDLAALEPDEGEDDLGLEDVEFGESPDDTAFEDDLADGVFGDDIDEGFEDGDGDEDDSEDSDDENGGEDGEDDDGGGKSFAELKEEFESGEADWAEDISDSPGGDMRLDE